MSDLVYCHLASRTFGIGDHATVALRPTTCTVSEGSRIAITGASGSGKSTLLHLLAGLDEPSNGTVTWPALGRRTDLRPGPVAMIFQGPSLIESLNVIENVALPLQLAGTSYETSIGEAERALGLLDLAELASKLPDEISGGQAQRVAVARAIAARPALILADEPTSQLDQGNGAHVIEVLLEAARMSGAALVVATHDHSIADRLVTRWSVTNGVVAQDRGSTP